MNIKIFNGVNFIKKNWHKLVIAIYFLIIPISVIYANMETCKPGTICNPIEATDIKGVIEFALTGALKLGIPVVALAIIYAGFLFVFARGNPEAITKAKDVLLYTLIGAAILIGAWSIAKLIQATVTTIGS